LSICGNSFWNYEKAPIKVIKNQLYPTPLASICFHLIFCQVHRNIPEIFCLKRKICQHLIKKTFGMKAILVPTDFSETADNAIDYAANLAVFIKSKLILFHVFSIPVLVSEIPLTTTPEDEQLEERSNGQLKIIAEAIRKKHDPNLIVEFLSTAGSVSAEISNTAKENNCDLIVMGTHGLAGMNRFFGSDTAEVIKHTGSDVLVIPREVKFIKIDKIVLTLDFRALQNVSVFNPLIELASLFDSEIMILNVEDNQIHNALEKEEEGIHLEKIFKNIKHTYWFNEQKNMADAINEFATDKHAVMIVMIKRHHNLLEQLFTQSNTKVMALHTHLPLLVLQEEADNKI
jgi:nucleotide-binding universal stress UspA family protein